MKVYSLQVNYDYEGSNLLGVFESPDEAKTWLKINYDFEGKWVKTGWLNDESAQIDSNSEYEIAEWDLDANRLLNPTEGET